MKAITFNHGVVGSSPTALTKQNQRLNTHFPTDFLNPINRLAHTLHTRGA